MQFKLIPNANILCSTLKTLLADDIEYLKTHPNPKYQWGNHSSNMCAKFNQFDELFTLPVFDQLPGSGYQLDKVFLYYIKPMTTKILVNIDVDTKKLNNFSILIPIDYTPSSIYVWYSSDYVKPHHTMADIPTLFKEYGTKVVAGVTSFKEETPMIVENKNNWSGISNKDNPNQFVFLELTFKGNPTYNDVALMF
jgi:hypothetical protein